MQTQLFSYELMCPRHETLDKIAGQILLKGATKTSIQIFHHLVIRHVWLHWPEVILHGHKISHHALFAIFIWIGRVLIIHI